MQKDKIILTLLIASCHWALHISNALTSPSSFPHLQSITIRSTTANEGFQSSQTSDNKRSWTRALQPLHVQRSASGPGKKIGPGANKKKKAGPPTNKKGNPKKTRKTTNTEKKAEKFASIAPKDTSSDQPKKKKQSHQAPPWQVVSKKDMARNIQAEKKRRQLAKEEGIHNVDVLQQEAMMEGIDSNLRLSGSFFSVQDKALLAWKRFKAQPRQDKVEFVGAYLNKEIPPTLGAPEVAFLGRSNVGKSSLLNRLTQSEEARVGKTPGATASVNLYGYYRGDATSKNKNKAAKCLLGLVDLPGFGYAKLSKENKDAVQMAAERYLAERKELMLGILLVDIRRVPSDDDKAVLAALYDSGVPIIVVATKVDKITTVPLNGDNGPPPSELINALQAINEGLGLPEGQPLCVSSVTGAGIKDMWRIIMEACEDGVEELRQKLLEQGGEDDKESFNEAEAFEDEEDVVYSQGYDWIHDSASVMYEDEYGNNDGYADYVGWSDEGDDVDFEDGDFDEYDDPSFDILQDGSMPRKSLKELRQQADEMQRRGQL